MQNILCWLSGSSTDQSVLFGYAQTALNADATFEFRPHNKGLLQTILLCSSDLLQTRKLYQTLLSTYTHIIILWVNKNVTIMWQEAYLVSSLTALFFAVAHVKYICTYKNMLGKYRSGFLSLENNFPSKFTFENFEILSTSIITVEYQWF